MRPINQESDAAPPGNGRSGLERTKTDGAAQRAPDTPAKQETKHAASRSYKLRERKAVDYTPAAATRALYYQQTDASSAKRAREDMPPSSSGGDGSANGRTGGGVATARVREAVQEVRVDGELFRVGRFYYACAGQGLIPEEAWAAFDELEPCAMCGERPMEEDEQGLLECDGCARGFHLACVQLEQLPEGAWRCPTCAQGLPPPPRPPLTRREAFQQGLLQVYRIEALWVERRRRGQGVGPGPGGGGAARALDGGLEGRAPEHAVEGGGLLGAQGAQGSGGDDGVEMEEETAGGAEAEAKCFWRGTWYCRPEDTLPGRQASQVARDVLRTDMVEEDSCSCLVPGVEVAVLGGAEFEASAEEDLYRCTAHVPGHLTRGGAGTARGRKPPRAWAPCAALPRRPARFSGCTNTCFERAWVTEHACPPRFTRDDVLSVCRPLASVRQELAGGGVKTVYFLDEPRTFAGIEVITLPRITDHFVPLLEQWVLEELEPMLERHASEKASSGCGGGTHSEETGRLPRWVDFSAHAARAKFMFGYAYSHYNEPGKPPQVFNTGVPQLPAVIQEVAAALAEANVLPAAGCVNMAALNLYRRPGSSLGSHWDHPRVWQTPIVTINLLSDACLSIGPNMRRCHAEDLRLWRVPLPRGSVSVMAGPSTLLKHAVCQPDVTAKRASLILRMMMPAFMEQPAPSSSQQPPAAGAEQPLPGSQRPLLAGAEQLPPGSQQLPLAGTEQLLPGSQQPSPTGAKQLPPDSQRPPPAGATQLWPACKQQPSSADAEQLPPADAQQLRVAAMEQLLPAAVRLLSTDMHPLPLLPQQLPMRQRQQVQQEAQAERQAQPASLINGAGIGASVALPQPQPPCTPANAAAAPAVVAPLANIICKGLVANDICRG